MRVPNVILQERIVAKNWSGRLQKMVKAIHVVKIVTIMVHDTAVIVVVLQVDAPFVFGQSWRGFKDVGIAVKAASDGFAVVRTEKNMYILVGDFLFLIYLSCRLR